VDATIYCGLAGTVMRFVPPLMALLQGQARFDGDEAARARPMSATLDALGQLGLGVESSEGKLPFTLTNTGALSHGTLRIDASASSQFVSGLLLVAPRLPEGLRIEHTGSELPSIPHIDMTLECLRARGVKADMVEPGVWVVEAWSDFRSLGDD
jgi:3-phosphoshikimate 1-carboxyvinyltransferase